MKVYILQELCDHGISRELPYVSLKVFSTKEKAIEAFNEEKKEYDSYTLGEYDTYDVDEENYVLTYIDSDYDECRTIEIIEKEII